MEKEIPAFTRAFKRLFGEEAFIKMTESQLPSKAEEYLEAECECGDKLYTFLQRLHENPFELESETDSQDSGDSGNEATSTSASEKETENGNGYENDEAPETPPEGQSPQPPEAKIAKLDT